MAEASQLEWRESPDEPGWWWWWNGDDDCIPVPVSIMYSGSEGVLFATVGQLGWTEPQFVVQDWSGYWMRFPEPEPPETVDPVEPDPEPVAQTLEEEMKQGNKVLEAFARRIAGMLAEARAIGSGHLNDRINTLEAQLKSAAGTVRVCKGAGRCTYCDGDGCDTCCDSGWLTKVQLESAPKR